MVESWLKLHRKIIDWQWFSDPPCVSLFLYLLTKASIDKKTWKDEVLEPGQLIFGRASASLKTGLSEQQIRTAMNKLKSTNEITIKTTNKYSIITIVRWDEYQAYQPANQPAINQQSTTSIELKNKRIIKEKNTKKEKAQEEDLFDDLPNWLDKDSWKGYLEMRTLKKSPPTPHAINLAIKKLYEFKKQGYNPNDILDQSTLNGWTGLFTPKNWKNDAYQRNTSKSDKPGNRVVL